MLNNFSPHKNWHFALIGGLLALLAILVSFFFVTPAGVIAVWPASGVILALLLLTPQSKWGWILGGVFIANIATSLMTGFSIEVSLGFAGVACLESCVAGWSFKQFYKNPIRFNHPKEIIILGAVCAGATNMLTSLAGAQVLQWAYQDSFFELWRGWFVADGLGILLLTPLVVLWSNARWNIPKLSTSHQLEQLIFILMLSFTTLAIFPLIKTRHLLTIDEPYLLYIFFIWSALRFTLKTNISILFMISIIAVQSTMLGYGHFSDGSFEYNVINAQQFLFVTILATMILATTTNTYKQVLTSLRRSEERYRQVVENQTELISRYLPDFTLTFVNEPYAKNFGNTSEEIIGQNLLDIIRPEDRPTLLAKLNSLSPTKPRASSRHSSRSTSGTLQWYEWADLALYDVAGQVIEYQGVGRDITDHIQAEKLEIELQQEKEVNALRAQIIALVSHEFRTPLSIMLTSTSLLDQYFEKFTAEERTERIKKIQGQINHLTHLLNDMTLLNTPEDKRYDLEPIALDVSATLQQIIEHVQTIFPEHCPITVQYVGEPFLFKSDIFLLQQIFTNLLSNSVKYSRSHDKITIECRYEPAGIVVQIQDTGIGIPADDQSQLFQAFYRGSNVGTLRGTGLGLVLVKSAVAAHHGTLTFTSAVDAGTTFTVTLPMLEKDS